MSRLSRRDRSRNKGRIAGWIYGCFGGAIIVSIVIFAGAITLSKRATDRATACPTDHYDSISAILVDLTDQVRPSQAAALRNALLKTRNDVPQFGRLEIYPLRSVAKTTLDTLFAGCSPGSGRDVSSWLYGNPELADHLWQKQFADKVDKVLNDIQNLPQGSNSPLLEGIQSVAVTAFGAPTVKTTADKRLVIISDMIHYTTDLSMYQGAPAFDRFKTTQYYTKIKPFLRGANVDIFLIVRDTRRNVQQPPLLKFWVDFFAASDGYLRSWDPLQ
jgi:hypothetical protein